MRTFDEAARTLFPAVSIATTDEEREEIFRLRYRVYFQECRRDVPAADHERGMIPEDPDDGRYLLYARKDGRIVGTVRLDIGGPDPAPSPVREWFGLDRFDEHPPERLAFSYQLIVAPEYRRTTVTLQLIKACFWLGRRHRTRFAFCGCSPHLLKLYETMGFRRYMANIDVPGHGYQIPMILLSGDHRYLTRIRSPFARMSSAADDDPATRAWFERRFPRRPGRQDERLIEGERLLRFVESRLKTDSCPLLSGLDRPALLRLVQAGSILECRAGDVVMREGQVSGGCALILSGAVEVSRGLGVRKDPVDWLVPGDVMGAGSYAIGSRRGADHVARSDLEVLYLTPQMVERAMCADEHSARRFASNLAAETARQRVVRTAIEAAREESA